MTATEERLQKVLARAGVGSRRQIEQLVLEGRIAVNGERAELGRRVDPLKDQVEVDGSPVPLRSDLHYYLFNKPRGIVTSSKDPQGRPTVMDVVDLPTRVWPVGRLDLDSEGALVLTNDGELTHRLTHPSYAVPKTYVAEVRGSPSRQALRTLSRGVPLDDGVTQPAGVRLLGSRAGSSLIELTITEGRNRQVRRMLAAVGHPVKHLVRAAIGPLELGRLKPGTLRRLSPDEVLALYRAASPHGGALHARPR